MLFIRYIRGLDFLNFLKYFRRNHSLSRKAISRLSHHDDVRRIQGKRFFLQNKILLVTVLSCFIIQLHTVVLELEMAQSSFVVLFSLLLHSSEIEIILAISFELFAVAQLDNLRKTFMNSLICTESKLFVKLSNAPAPQLLTTQCLRKRFRRCLQSLFLLHQLRYFQIHPFQLPQSDLHIYPVFVSVSSRFL